jgi:hypothetical protein
MLSFHIPAFATYNPVDGRITYLGGAMISTNFQETAFNNNDNVSKLGRSQSFGGVFQALGDLNTNASLMAEMTFGRHKFLKEKTDVVDEFILEAVSFDLGYRHRITERFWISGQLGSMYPWKIDQNVSSNQTPYNEEDFRSVYSLILGFQYEGSLYDKPVSYDVRVRKYMSGQLDDQMSIGFSIGWRFGVK